jgi:phosphatidate cytidylyltransferase
VNRILSALVLLAVVLGVLFWLPPAATLVMALVVLGAAVWELSRLAEHGSGALPRGLMVAAACAVLVAAASEGPVLHVTLLAALLSVGCVLVGEGHPEVDVLRRAGVMLLPVIYLALPIAAMVIVRARYGPNALVLLLATIMVSDTAQYYGGRALGRRPLAPRISPKKTVEGAVAGLCSGSLVLPLAGAATLPGQPLWALWLVGIVLAGLGIAGDLFESLLKRSAGVKDASGLIPGHGGILDRLDSLLFASPFYYGFLRSMG